MSGQKKKSPSPRYKWIVRFREREHHFIREGNSARGHMTYTEEYSGEWREFTIYGSILGKIVRSHFEHLSSAAKRRKYHSVERALEIAFKCQEIFHMYGLDFVVYNTETKEEIPVCSL